MAKKELAVGIDLGGTNTVFGFVDREGNILIEDRIKTSQYDEIEVFVAALYEKYSSVADFNPENIVMFGYSFNEWSVTEMLEKNLRFSHLPFFEQSLPLDRRSHRG